MSVINLSIKHGRTQEEARSRLEVAVAELSRSFGPAIRRVAWADDRHRVRIDGAGFWVELWVDDQDVHGTGDIPFLGGLLGSPLAAGLKQVVQQAFQKKLT
jgi:Putative polyhydroxyalkanoic acid system protein (PHA_gran_rgn)